MARTPPGQQSLFGPPAAPHARETSSPPPPPGFDFSAAAALPPSLRFGTSSWVYEGWKGQVYRQDYGSLTRFRQESLAEYARWPWFRAVGLDASFYGPPAPKTLARMAEQVPADFQWVSKVWEHLTLPRFPDHPRYGARAGQKNPTFLDPEVFVREVLPPYAPAAVRERTGPFLFEFAALPPRLLPHIEAFLDRLDAFFAALPKEHRYAVEARTPELLRPRYFELLARHGVSHCFNSWERMPPVGQQRALAARCGHAEAPRLLRLLTVPGLAYARSVQRFAPFDRLQEVAEDVRSDAVEVALDGLATGVGVVLLVNNRLEGNSPATIDALGRTILQRLSAQRSEG